ncbi:MAG: hypothetical protein HDR10_05375 [Lachnospiraceae bacterium]|nr:hypothetical protein [Lachnospiraceae bacterium]
MDFNGNQQIPPQENNYYNNPSFRNPGMAMATASLFLGLASFFMSMTVLFSLILGGLAILFALLSKGYGKKMITQAKIGFICGIGGLGATFFLIVSSVSMLLANPDMLIEIGIQYDTAIEEVYGQPTEELYGVSFEDMMTEYANLLNP